MYSLGAKLLVVCAGPRQLCIYRQQFLAPLTPTCISWSPASSITLVSSPREIAATLHLNLPLGVTNKGREAIKAISGAVVGDSSLQDRGVAHYLLSLLFSLVSLPFSFYLCVPYQKYQKS